MSEEISAGADSIDPSTQALEAALPEIRDAKTKGWIAVAVSVVLSAGVSLLVAGSESADFVWVILPLMLGLFGVLGAVGWTRARHERAVMPIVARAFGLGYEKSPPNFYAGLPKNFIPQGGRRSVDDMMSGTVANRRFRFAECKTETGGKNSSTLFKGVVLELTSAAGVPSFIIASERETKGFLFFKGRVRVDDMIMVHTLTASDGQVYGLWARSEDPARTAGQRVFMEKIIVLGPRVLGQSSLYSLVSTGDRYFVSLRHNRDLFKIGGLLADDVKVMQDIRNAASELGHPVQLVTEILRAEEAMLARA